MAWMRLIGKKTVQPEHQATCFGCRKLEDTYLSTATAVHTISGYCQHTGEMEMTFDDFIKVIGCNDYEPRTDDD